MKQARINIENKNCKTVIVAFCEVSFLFDFVRLRMAYMLITERKEKSVNCVPDFIKKKLFHSNGMVYECTMHTIRNLFFVFSIFFGLSFQILFLFFLLYLKQTGSFNRLLSDFQVFLLCFLQVSV